MTNKYTQAFENWCKSTGQFYDLTESVGKKGFYHENDTEEAFRAFCAGMMAVIFHLPDVCDLHPRKMLVSEIIKSLEKQGINYAQ